MAKKSLILVSVLLLLGFLFFPAFTSAQTQVDVKGKKDFHIFLSGAFSLVQEMGSDSDYVPGENDFPVTPSHSEFGGGIGFMFGLSDNLALKIEGDYLLGAEVEKEDPSDGETYTYKTYDNINVLGSLLFMFGDETKFFISGGAGANILMPYDDKEETGSLGSVIVIQKPDTTVNIMAAAGAGVLLDAGGLLIKIEGQYTMVFDYEKNSIFVKLGIGF